MKLFDQSGREMSELPKKDTRIWKDYVDSMTKVLLAEGDHAGIFDHTTLTGNAREHFVQKFLSQLLPDSVGVTGGKVFDRKGGKSNQIDVLIYDKSFPLLRIGNNSLLPVDSLLAAVEVKTQLDKPALKQSLDNCASLMGLGGLAYFMKEVGNVTIREKAPSIDEIDKLVLPGYYVLGYRGYESNADNLLKHVVEWISDKGVARIAVPRVIATPTTMCLRKRDDIKINAKNGNEALLLSTLSDASLNVFVADLLEKVLRRTAFINSYFVVRSVADYYDPNWYLNNYVKTGPGGWKTFTVDRTPEGW